MKTVFLLLFAAVAALPGGAAAQTTSKRLFVKAVDRSGAPVRDLTAADFFLAEGKSARKIIRVVPASAPVRIVMLVDDSKGMSSALTDIRRGLISFFDAIPAPHEIALVTVGNTPIVRQAPTADREVLKGLAQKLSTNGALMLLGAVLEMYDRFLKNVDDRWPMFVIVTNDGDDASRGVTEEQFIKVVKDMQAIDTVVHAVMISPNGKGSGGSVQITRSLTQATGGTYESISAASALPDKLTGVAKTILAHHQLSSAQYILDYESDSSSSTDPPKLASTRENVSLTLSQQGRIR
jgi:hypothetical protein